MKKLFTLLTVFCTATLLYADMIPEELIDIFDNVRNTGKRKYDDINSEWRTKVPRFVFVPEKWKVIVDGVEGKWYPYSGHKPLMEARNSIRNKQLYLYYYVTVWVTKGPNWIEEKEITLYNVVIKEPDDAKKRSAYKEKRYVRFTALCNELDSVEFDFELDMTESWISTALVTISRSIGEHKVLLVIYGRTFYNRCMNSPLYTIEDVR